MIEIVFYARGGQGAVTASQVLATAAFQEGKYAQAFPSFGVERRGAPVTAYARINESPILDRSTIEKADYVIVLASSLLKTSNPLDRLKEKGWAILNTDRSLKHLLDQNAPDGIKVFSIDATTISDKVYGKRSIPVTNVAMLGAFAAVTRIVLLDTLLDVIDQRFSGEASAKAKKTAHLAYEEMEGILAREPVGKETQPSE